jgi:hypothetical protein
LLIHFRLRYTESPKVSLHGGPKGFDFGVWQKLTQLDDATLFTKAEMQSLAARADASAAIFSLTSPDGDQGYSGALYLETLVVLLPPVKLGASTVPQHGLGSIVIVYRAKLVDLPEGQKKVTPINLTQVCVLVSLSLRIYSLSSALGFQSRCQPARGRRNAQGLKPWFDYQGKLHLTSTPPP